MASTIKLKNSTTAGNAPSSLAQGELAINVEDGKLFYGTTGGSKVSSSFAVSEITASGDISSSGDLIADDASFNSSITIRESGGNGLQLSNNNDKIYYDGDDILISIDDGDNHTFSSTGYTVNGNIIATNITASNISSSGYLWGNVIYGGTLSTTVGIINTGIHLGNTGYFTGAITASAFSASAGIVSGEHLFSSDDAEITDGLTVGGDINANGNIVGDCSTTISSMATISGSTIQAGSGSYHILQGDTSQNTALSIEGSITASGDISASGDLIAMTNIYAPNIGAGTDNSVVVLDSDGTFKTDEIDSRVWGSTLLDGTNGTNNELAIFTDSNSVEGDSDLTYDGTTFKAISNISASGVATFGTSGSGQTHIFYGRIRTIGSEVEIGGGHITASGNISSSGAQIECSTGSFDHIVTVGETIEFRNKDTRAIEGFMKFDTEDGLTIQDANKNTKANKPGLRLFRTGSHGAIGTTAEGDIVRFGNTATTPGDIYSLAETGLWQGADRREGHSTGSLAVAIATNATGGMLLRGMVRLDNDPDCGVGAPVYLGTSGHAVCTSADSGMYARVIGSYMSGSGTIYFNPDNSWVLRS